MKSEKAFLLGVLQYIDETDTQVKTTTGCAVQGSLYHRALRSIEGSARMRLKVLDSKDGSGPASTVPAVDTSGSKGTP